MAKSTMGRSPDAIATAIRSAIANREFKPGESLVQGDLARRFGVSRIPLREAMRTLQAEGLLESKGGGTCVMSLDLGRIEEIYELRRMIEPTFAERVIHHCSPAAVDKLKEAVTIMDAVDDIGADQWSRTNFAFHLDMYAIAHLPIRYELISRLYHQLEPYSRYYVHTTHALDRVQSEHHTMLSAITSGDADLLRTQIIAHIDGGQTALRSAWGIDPGASTANSIEQELKA